MTKLLFAVARRLAWAAALVVGVLGVTWAMTALLPGDPVQAAMGPQASPADVARARRLYGLDQPAHCRLLRYASRLVHVAPPEAQEPAEAAREPGLAGRLESCRPEPGEALVPEDHTSCKAVAGALHVDLGHSFTYRRPVIELVEKKLPASIELAIAATLVQLLVGVGLGAIAAARRGSRADDVVVGMSVALSAAPTFVVGLVLQYVLAYRGGLVPLDGYGETTGEWLASLVLPALTLGLYGTALTVRLVRGELGDALSRPFVLAARAKGASKLRAALVHALRNACPPIVQLAVLELGALFGGAVVTERLFRWPGLGEMAVLAVQNRDTQAIVGVTLVASCAIVLATAAADVVGMLLDPRLRER